MKLFSFIFLFLFLSKQQEPKSKYSWKGKEVTYKQYRDSLRVEYIKYCEDLQKRNKLDSFRRGK